jgi:hypothetical protein
MIGPKAEGSTVDVELVAEATALTRGGLLDGSTLGANELGTSLADAVDAAADEATGALLATEAE